MDEKMCPLCGKPTVMGVVHSDAVVYHMKCLKNSPDVVQRRDIVQKLLPENERV